MLFNNFKDYLSFEKKFSANTIAAYLRDINDFQKFLNDNGTKISKEINYSFIRQWIVVLSEKKYSKISINRKIASLKSYFDYLVNIEIINSSPLKGHKNLKSSSKIVIPFSEAEMDKVFENLESNDMNNRDRLMIEIFYSTGIRRDELINIKLVDILFDSKVIKVLGKRNKQRMIPMLPYLLSNIVDYINNSDPKIYLFESKKSKKLSTSTIYRIINKYFRSVSSKVKISPHVLRHTFATHMLNNGADINAIKELLGHANLSATQVYTHNTIEKLKSIYKQAHPRA